ncbi:hypothetical protein DFS34DRAFT_591 [Phlyctochytrium arcticum]|nr:hypothetical protein DFS34DRAFT_591 [Phlyctochytrium arcticum]
MDFQQLFLDILLKLGYKDWSLESALRTLASQGQFCSDDNPELIAAWKSCLTTISTDWKAFNKNLKSKAEKLLKGADSVFNHPPILLIFDEVDLRVAEKRDALDVAKQTSSAAGLIMQFGQKRLGNFLKDNHLKRKKSVPSAAETDSSPTVAEPPLVRNREFEIPTADMNVATTHKLKLQDKDRKGLSDTLLYAMTDRDKARLPSSVRTEFEKNRNDQRVLKTLGTPIPQCLYRVKQGT